MVLIPVHPRHGFSSNGTRVRDFSNDKNYRDLVEADYFHVGLNGNFSEPGFIGNMEALFREIG